MRLEHNLYIPDWNLPAGVLALVSTRKGGVSETSWASFNLGEHVGDSPAHVANNRARFFTVLESYSTRPLHGVQWLAQVHGTNVHVASRGSIAVVPHADAAFTTEPGVACTVLTADCLPVLFCADTANAVAVAHAGWRGLLAGVLEATLAHFDHPESVSAWLGPAIGPCHFEVGPEVRAAFIAAAHIEDQNDTRAAFGESDRDKWLANLYDLASIRLRRAGLIRISGKPRCTVCDSQHWYSYRREAVTGRFATLIMLTSQPQVNSHE